MNFSAPIDNRFLVPLLARIDRAFPTPTQRFWAIFIPPLVMIGGCFAMLHYAETRQEGSIGDMLRFLVPAWTQTPEQLLDVELLFLFLLLLFPTLVGSWLLAMAITRSKNVVKELRRLAMAVESSGESILITNPVGEIQYVNPAFVALTGRTREEVAGQNPRILRSSRADAASHQQLWATLNRGEQWCGRLLNYRESGAAGASRHYWIQATISPIRHGRELLGYVGIEHDITAEVERETAMEAERQSAEIRATIARQLQEATPLRERLKAALGYLLSVEGLGIQPAQGGIFLRPANGHFLEQYLLHGNFPEDFIRREQRIPLGSCLCGRAAETGELLISENCFSDSRHERNYEGMPAHGHFIIPLVHSTEVLGVLFLYTAPHPVVQPIHLLTLHLVGEMMGLAIAGDRLQQNIRRNQEALIQAEKLASLGQLVAGIAHEINTPIGIGITAASHFADITRTLVNAHQQQTMKRSDLEKYLSEASKTSDLILNNLLRTGDLIRSFKMISADQASQEKRRFPLKAYLQDILLHLQPKLKKSPHQVHIVCPHELELESFPGALAQVITNLIFNALYHAFDPEQPGEILLTAHQVDQEIVLTFADNGKGIEENHLPHIFDPFFTTKRGQGGTGLGLNIVFNLVHQTLQGRVSCTSTPGEGTTFTLHLPMRCC